MNLYRLPCLNRVRTNSPIAKKLEDFSLNFIANVSYTKPFIYLLFDAPDSWCWARLPSREHFQEYINFEISNLKNTLSSKLLILGFWHSMHSVANAYSRAGSMSFSYLWKWKTIKKIWSERSETWEDINIVRLF